MVFRRVGRLRFRPVSLLVLCVALTTPAALAQAPAPQAAAAAPAMPSRFVLDAAAKLEPGAVRVAPDLAYADDRGYGFTHQFDGNERSFGIKASPGDYRVRVTLGSKTSASRTTVLTEDRRLMAAPVVLKKGQFRTIEFIADVRDPAVIASEQDAAGRAPRVGLRGDDDQSRNWDDRLTVMFSGSAPAVQSVQIEPVTVRRVVLAGDSTVADMGGADYASWGQMLPRFLSSDIAVSNHARGGETMKSFVTSLRWDKLLSEVRAGDVVVIQFGHNDQKKGWPRTYSDPVYAYPAWLRAFASDIQARNAKVVLVSPVSRRSFDKAGMIDNTLAGYDDAVRKVSADLSVPLVDLTAQTRTLYETLGPDVSPMAFAGGGRDKTHHNAYGAYQIANYVAQALSDPKNGLGVKTTVDFAPFDPAHPADPKAYDLTPADWPLMKARAVTMSGN